MDSSPGPVSWSNNYRGFLRHCQCPSDESSTPAPAAGLSRTSKIPPGPRARRLGLRVRRQQWPVDKVANLPALIFTHRRQMGKALSPTRRSESLWHAGRSEPGPEGAQFAG
jgi:hypothetical protein